MKSHDRWNAEGVAEIRTWQDIEGEWTMWWGWVYFCRSGVGPGSTFIMWGVDGYCFPSPYHFPGVG